MTRRANAPGRCIDTPAGERLELVDGGFTDWTQQLLGNRKERLLITGIGLERLSGARTT